MNHNKQCRKPQLGYKAAGGMLLMGVVLGLIGASFYHENLRAVQPGPPSTAPSATASDTTSTRTEQGGGAFEKQVLLTLLAVGFGHWLAPKQSESKVAEECQGPVETSPQETSAAEGGGDPDPVEWSVGEVPVLAAPATPLPVPEEGLVWCTNASFRNGTGKFHRVMSCGPLREAPSGIAASLRSELEGRGLTSCLLCF